MKKLDETHLLTHLVSYVCFFFLVAKNIAHNNIKRKKAP